MVWLMDKKGKPKHTSDDYDPFRFGLSSVAYRGVRAKLADSWWCDFEIPVSTTKCHENTQQHTFIVYIFNPYNQISQSDVLD